MAHLKGGVSNARPGKERRRQLRHALTPAEAALWTLLKSKGLDGVKFRRQHGVGPYVLDFYCPKHKICVELDGAPHFTPEGILRDEDRDRYLKGLGIQVLRFSNDSVFQEPYWVLEAIRFVI